MRDDPLIDRLRRDAVISCAAMAGIAAGITRGDWRAAVSVLGGGVLIAVSFLSIRSGVDHVSAFAAGSRDRAPRHKTGLALVKIGGRYALLAFLAYVMIVRLRLSPLGLIAGASSIVAAAAVEAGRFFFRKEAGRFFWKKT